MASRRVVRAWVRSCDAAIRGRRGERVALGEVDAEARDWRWCTATDGRGGWVPIALLEYDGPQGVLREDYDAMELTVAVDDTVECRMERAGWGWCTDARGNAGWVPLENLSKMSI